MTRKYGTHARVLYTTHAQGNSKNEITQNDEKRIQAEKENLKSNKKINPKSLAIAGDCIPTGSLLPEAVDELPN